MKPARETWIENRCRKIDGNVAWGDNTKALCLPKTLTIEVQQKTFAIEDHEGRLILDDKAVLDRILQRPLQLSVDDGPEHPHRTAREPASPMERG